MPQLLKDGRVARGWLGVALQAVAVPETLREAANQSGGLMVMSIVKDGPAAQAGIVAGDIILSVNGTPTQPFRKIARHFGSESIGRKADLGHPRRSRDYRANINCGAPSGMSVATKKLAVTGPLRIVIDAPILRGSMPKHGRRNRTHCCRRFEVG